MESTGSSETQDTRLQEWLERMSLAQKIGQMTMAERMWATPEDVKRYALGSVLSGGGSHPGDNTVEDWVRMNDAYWQAAAGDDDSPGIPILFGVDAVHGHNNVRGATIFPHNIAYGAADDADLVAAMARVTAREIIASGIEWNFAPTLAVAQDCRWGRTYESYGNDPERAGRFGEAYVRALQQEGVIACAKHWVGDGGTRHGIDQGDTVLSWADLEATHVAPYYPALRAGVMSVMVSFNSWNGDKCHGHYRLVTELLKERLGFDGIVVSDWDGIDYLDEDYEVAIRESVNAGLDMFMVPEDWKRFIAGLERQVLSGQVSEERIDDAVRRILRTKLRYGLFDMPRPAERTRAHARAFGSPEHRDIAREAVRKSLVLLKNEAGALPLSSEKRILVAGKSANDLGLQCGGWSHSWQGEAGNDVLTGSTIWDGIRARAPHAELSASGNGDEADPACHDVAVVVIGEKPYAEGFGDIRADDDIVVELGSSIRGTTKPLEPYARSMALAEIHPEDLACIERIRDAGVPVVAVLVSGRPLITTPEIEASSAFVAAWLPGSEGDGVAEVLFGESDFQGRLPMPWPDSAKTGGADYEQRWPAGYGLRIETGLLSRTGTDDQ